MAKQPDLYLGNDGENRYFFPSEHPRFFDILDVLDNQGEVEAMNYIRRQNLLNAIYTK